MSYTHPHQNEFTNISFAHQTDFKTAIAVASCSGWIGILQENQELPWRQPENRILYSSGKTLDLSDATGDGTDGSAVELAGAQPLTVIEGKNTYQGRLKWVPQNRQMFPYIFGRTHAQDNTTYYTFTYEAGVLTNPTGNILSGGRPLPSFTLCAWLDKAGDGYTDADDICNLWTGCKFGSTTFNFAEGEELTIESDVQAIAQTNQTAFPTTSSTGFRQNTKKPYLMNQGALTVFGGAYARIKSGTITINHNLEPKWYDGTDPYDLVEKRVTYECSLTLVAHNDDLYDLQNVSGGPIAATDITIVFTRATNDTLTLKTTATGSTNNAYPRIKPAFGGGEGEVEVTIDFDILRLQALVSELDSDTQTLSQGKLYHFPA